VNAFDNPVIPLFPLRASDDLANTGKKNIHRGNRFSVFILPHVKSLDGGRVIVQDHRFLKMFLNKEAFVFRLKINAPLVDDVLKFLFLIWIGVFQNVDRFRIA
jgi:hypothetical protein